MAEILQPRACELIQLVKKNLRDADVLEALCAGCVLTGGGAMLRGMLDVTESQLRVPARTGVPVRLSHMPGELVHPSFCAAIGMILYTQRMRTSSATQGGTWRSRFGDMFGGSY
jgi:cell division protein FtsA